MRGFSRLMVQSLALLGFIANMLCAPRLALSQENEARPTELRQVASDPYFFYDYSGSNSVFLVTDEGVLVIDTRQHPRPADELIGIIRKVTDKPIRWAINNHFHGDHTFGNAAFKAQGATLVAHQETARLMQLVQPKEMSRRAGYFKSHGYDPNAVKLVLPDVTFDKSMTIRCA